MGCARVSTPQREDVAQATPSGDSYISAHQQALHLASLLTQAGNEAAAPLQTRADSEDDVLCRPSSTDSKPASQGEGEPSDGDGSDHTPSLSGGCTQPGPRSLESDSPAEADMVLRSDEPERLKALMALGVIGAEREGRFDCITGLMKQIFQVPVSVATLICDDVIYMQSWAGEWACQAPRRGSFCDWILAAPTPSMLIVEDALSDARFAGNKYVCGPPGVRFYAGCPLVGSCGHRYGTLCIMDFVPRAFTAEQYTLLCQFGELTVRELEREKMVADQQREVEGSVQAAAESKGRVLRALDALEEAVVLVDVSTSEWPLVYANEEWTAATAVAAGAPAGGDEGAAFWQLYCKGGHAVDVMQMAHALEASRSRRPFELTITSKAGVTLNVRFKPAGKESQVGVAAMPAVSVPAGISFDRQAAAAPGDSGRQSPPPRLARPAINPALSSTKAAALSAALAALTTSGQQGADMATIDATARAVAAFTAETSVRQSAEVEPVYYLGVISKVRQVLQTSTKQQNAGDTHVTKGSAARAAPAPLHDSASSASCHGASRGSGDLPPTPPSPCSLPDAGGVAAVQEQQQQSGQPGGTAAKWLDGELRPEAFHDVCLGTRVGSGSMGRCYRAQWRGSRVAVKVLDLWEKQGEGGRWPQGGGSTASCVDWSGSSGDSDLVAVSQQSYAAQNNNNGLAEALGAWSTALALPHPNLLPTYAAAVAVGDAPAADVAGAAAPGPTKHHTQVWLVQKWCSHGTLVDAVERGALRTAHGGPDLRAVLLTAREVAGAMAFLHSNGLLHGALAGTNVLLTAGAVAGPEDGRGWCAQVADFASARLVQASGARGPAGSVQASSMFGGFGPQAAGLKLSAQGKLGNVTYLPPEVLLGGEAGAAADVFAFGVLLWEMCSSRRAWRWVSPVQVVHAVALEGCQLPVPRDVPPGLQAILKRCLDHDPHVRPNFDLISMELAAQLAAEQRAGRA